MKAINILLCLVFFPFFEVLASLGEKNPEYNPPVITLEVKKNGGIFLSDLEIKKEDLFFIFSKANERKWFLFIYIEDGASKDDLAVLVGKAVSNGCHQVIIFNVPEV